LIRSLDKSIVIGGALIAALLLASATLDFVNTRRLNDDAASVDHAQDVLNLSAVSLRTLMDAEASVWGFLASGKDEYLKSCESSAKRLDGLLAELRQRTADYPEQLDRIARLKGAVAARLQRLREAAALRAASVEKARSLLASGSGAAELTSLRALAGEIEGAENAVLDERERRSHHTYLVAQAGALLSAAVGFLMIVGFCWLLHRRFADANKIQEAEILKVADARKNEFLATLAHELRNPLAPIRTAVELLGQAEEDPNVLTTAHTIMTRQVSHMVRLIDDLRDISRIAKGKLQLHKEPIELAAVVQSALEATRPVVEAARHGLTVSLPTEPVRLNADPTRLAQVFSNLLNNAAKYTDAGGQIWLAAERHEDEVVISVRDTGIGLDAEFLTHIFDMYSQLTPARERSQGGLGIGLALVRGLVELNGGSVEARSDGPGRGSEFVVRLPALPDSVETAGPRKNAGVSEPPILPKRRILVVDDNHDAATSLALLLRRLGHEVHTAHDGLEAVDTAAVCRS
jgi:signal transduction histidine kinase